MLYPALAMKLVCFKNQNGETSRMPKQGFNTITAQLDSGEVIDIDIMSNDTELNSLHDYLIQKAEQSVKTDKAKALAMDMLFSDKIDTVKDKITAIENKLIENGVQPAKAKQEAAIEFVKEKLKNDSTIQSTSVFRMALAAGFNNKYNSRSIYVKTEKGEKQYSTTGIYVQAQLANQIPIELSYIYNKEMEPVGFLKVKTSTLINANQINYLLDHSWRTITESLRQGKKPFLPSFVVTSRNTEYENLAASFNVWKKKSKETKLTANDYELIKELLMQIKNSLITNPKQYPLFQMELPFLLHNEKFQAAIKTVDDKKGKSPFQAMREALVNLNFSKENPETKKKLKKAILDVFIMPIVNAQYNPKMLAVYNIPSANFFGESDSWGFMENNIDFSKLILGKQDIDNIFEYVNKMKEGLS